MKMYRDRRGRFQKNNLNCANEINDPHIVSNECITLKVANFFAIFIENKPFLM